MQKGSFSMADQNAKNSLIWMKLGTRRFLKSNFWFSGYESMDKLYLKKYRILRGKFQPSKS